MADEKCNRLLILFASQSGTSQEVAERIGREGRRRHYKYRVFAMDDYPVKQLLSESLLVVIAATTGQGDPPDNMKRFWKFLLRKDLPSTSLSNLKFAVLGLGDSSYVKFNFIAKKLFRRFMQLGATPIQEIGLADDQHPGGFDAIADPWITVMWENVLHLWPLKPGQKIISSDVKPTSRFRVVEDAGDVKQLNVEQNVNGISSEWPQEQPFLSHVVENSRVTSTDHFQDVRRITFDIRGSDLKYNPGDVLMIKPNNVKKAVNEFITLLKLDPDRKIRLEKNDPDFDVPRCFQNFATLREIIEKHLDIQGVPRRHFFELLSHFTPSELEKERLQEFSKSEGQEDLLSYCTRQRRSYLEVFQDFPFATSSVTLDYLFDLIPLLKPRAFSIASSQKVSPNSVQILMAVVNYKTKLARPREGVCSTWLSELRPQNENAVSVPIWITKGSFSFPKTEPLIMVGPGTGCAPFRSYLQEWSSDETLRKNQECCMFFGCRNRRKDFLLESDFQQMLCNKLLTTFTAFSRDQKNKVYVQHLLKENGKLVWNYLNKGAFVYIAGNAKQMPNDVTRALKEIVEIEGHLNEQEAETYIRKLELGRRLQCETWS